MNTKQFKKIILITLISLFLFIIGLFLIIVFTGSSITIGRYIQSDTGEHLVADKIASTVMHSDHDFMFRNLSSGDKILVIHGLTNLSYPGSTDAYFCMKLSDGEITDVPAKILLELYDLGWVGKSESNFPYKFKKASFQSGFVSMNLTLLDTWEYEYKFAETIEDPYGIAFWPKDVTEGRLELLCYPNAYHLKCGTGLHTEETVLNGFEATKGYYDQTESALDPVHHLNKWSYIHFNGSFSSYVFHNYATELWTDNQLAELDYILNTVDFPHIVMQ